MGFKFRYKNYVNDKIPKKGNTMTNLMKYLEEREEKIERKWKGVCEAECTVLDYIYGVNWDYYNKLSLLDVMQAYVEEFLDKEYQTTRFWLYCPMDEIKEWLAARYLTELGYVECEADFLALFSVFIDEAEVFDLDTCFDVAMDSLDYTKKTCGVGNGLSLYKDGAVLLH